MAGRASFPNLGRTSVAPNRSARWDRDFFDEREHDMTLERGRGPGRDRFEALPIRTRNPDDDDDYFRQSRRVPPPREHSVDDGRFMRDRRARRPRFDEEEDDELLFRERRRTMYDDFETPRPPSTTRRRRSPSASSFVRRRPSPERERFRSPSPPTRPTARMRRRTSSVDTYDRKPKGFYDREEYDPPARRSDYRIPPNVPIPLPRHKALPPPRVYAEHDYFQDIQVSDPYRYGDEDFHAFPGGEKFREREVEKEVIHTRRGRRDRSRDSRTSRATSRSRRSSRRSRSVASSTSSSSSSSGGTTITSKSEYPKKGKTRIPSRLLSRRALIESGFPFVEEGTTTIIQKALGQEHIDHLLKMSDEYKKAELEIHAARSSAGDVIEEREESRTEIIEYTDTPIPGPPHHTTHYTQTTTHAHPHVHTTTVHTHSPVQATYTQPVMVNATPPVHTQQVDFAKTVQVRDVSPSRASSYSSWDSTSSWTDLTCTTGTSCSTCSTATIAPRGHVHTPQVVHVAHPDEFSKELMILDESHGMSRSRSRHRSRSRSRHHSRHRSRHRSSHRSRHRSQSRRSRSRHHSYEKERHGSRGNLVLAERLATGELVLREEEVERIEEPRRGVRLEKDKRGPPPRLVKAMLATLT
ncbi:hypothetical protein NCU05527 [Neurospora crassa OR74A]|uniref:DUF8035 domain-containing protein n=1 Tax=Neurospora crassa (strain ATCC 24698 / 74-OR23-1A / CBS 708.71 / DSM 1257 / FGSC 987) TaxID=367110 RepID=Q7S6R3_NEUCR|nr:hypothetical protein NCU05527 [Neurospora crassa OR74A]EAA31253.2 hypothetical protein NCU05527 [Neurospora crassa OR74A]|eukprot:XP_960489.2 hypothetical protein NCU05527 [Neurospora crassa OR74A]